MHKTINVYNNTKQLSNNLYNVSLDRLDSVANYSLNQIVSSSLNYLDLNSIPRVVGVMFQKIKLGGSCLFQIVNMKDICSLYVKGSVDDTTLFNLLNERVNYISIPALKAIIDADSNFNITSIDTHKFITSISIERVKL